MWKPSNNIILYIHSVYVRQQNGQLNYYINLNSLERLEYQLEERPSYVIVYTKVS